MTRGFSKETQARFVWYARFYITTKHSVEGDSRFFKENFSSFREKSIPSPPNSPVYEKVTKRLHSCVYIHIDRSKLSPLPQTSGTLVWTLGCSEQHRLCKVSRADKKKYKFHVAYVWSSSRKYSQKFVKSRLYIYFFLFYLSFFNTLKTVTSGFLTRSSNYLMNDWNDSHLTSVLMFY